MSNASDYKNAHEIYDTDTLIEIQTLLEDKYQKQVEVDNEHLSKCNSIFRRNHIQRQKQLCFNNDDNS